MGELRVTPYCLGGLTLSLVYLSSRLVFSLCFPIGAVKHLVTFCSSIHPHPPSLPSTTTITSHLLQKTDSTSLQAQSETSAQHDVQIVCGAITKTARLEAHVTNMAGMDGDGCERERKCDRQRAKCRKSFIICDGMEAALSERVEDVVALKSWNANHSI